MTYSILLLISAALVNNIVLTKFLGICSFLGVSRKLETAIGMSFSVAAVIMISSVISWIVYYAVLIPFDIMYLQTIVFVFVIAAVVQLLEMFLEKYVPELYSSLGIFLPLITTNCIILGVAIINIKDGYNFINMVVFSFGTSLGYAIAIIIFSGLREYIDQSVISKNFRGIPIAFITAGILSLAFMGFSGMVKL